MEASLAQGTGSRSTDRDRLVERSAAAAVGIAGLAFLAGRPAFAGEIRSAPWLLTLGYGLLLASPIAAARVSRVRSPGSRLPAGAVALVGAGAVLAARLLAQPAFPARSGAAIVALNTLAAVAEEAFFRGFLYARLERMHRRPGSMAGAVAVAGSAVAFALVHVPAYGLAAFPVDLGAGLLLSWQRWASGRWTVPAATHALANLLAVIR